MTMKTTTRRAKPAPKALGVNERPVDGVRPEAIAQDAEPAAKRELHCNGIPVSKLPLHVQGLIAYGMTDEGIAEANAKRVDSKGNPHSGVQVLVNEGFDQLIRKRNESQDIDECADPFVECQKKYGRPGFRGRMLSPGTIKKRGMRNWEARLDAKGDPVQVGNMIFAEMPEDRAERRNKKYRDEGNASAAAATERFISDHERSAYDAGEGVRALRSGETLTDDGDPNRQISIGVRSSQGTRADAAA